MNKLKFLLLTLIVTAFCIAGCEKEIAPVLTFDGKETMTIAEFQQLHVLSATQPSTLIDTNVVISGIVTSTDAFGSCYKEIFFQDATGGLSIRTASTAYAKKYRIGQRIFVKAKDLYLGNYVSSSGWEGSISYYQIGLLGGDRITLQYIPTDVENRHIFRSGVPVATPTTKKITKPTDIKETDYHCLVELVNVRFNEANGITRYFEPDGTYTTISRNISFNLGGGTVVARISAFSTFANDTLPRGAHNIVGILTKYGTTPQLILRNTTDVVKLPTPKTLFEFDMQTDPFSLGSLSWTNQKIIETGNEWTYIPSNPNRVNINSNGVESTDCWFVSPKLNCSTEENVALFFKYRLTAGTAENAQLHYTTNGSDWHNLPFEIKLGDEKEIALMLNKSITSNPNLQIAFKYKTTTVRPTWMLLNITLKANVIM